MDKNGRFQFDELPPGKYEIKIAPEDQKEHRLKPDSRIVNVETLTKTFVPSFQVVESNLEGKVISLSGGPVAFASILIDDLDITASDENGVYYLDS